MPGGVNIGTGKKDTIHSDREHTKVLRQDWTFQNDYHIHCCVFSTTIQLFPTKILELNPWEHEFNIPDINTMLVIIYVLATPRICELDQRKRIQHTINAYGKILQPEQWAQATQNRVDDFESDLVKDYQTLMNAAVLK